MSERCKVCDRAGCPAVTNDPEPEHTDAPKWECPRCVAITDCAAHAVDWRARALAAEQRAEAAEAARDRMRADLDALPRYMLYLTGHSGSALVTHAVDPNGAWVKFEDVTAIDAYRAGHPATSEAERIAATLVCSTCNDTHRMTLGDREVPCTRCPVPCETCRSRPVGAGPGAYCAGTPCGCPCHRAGAWRKP